MLAMGRTMTAACTAITLLALSCATCLAVKKIDPTAFEPDAGSEIQIPKDMSAYAPATVIRVAVVDFTNNTYGAVSVPAGWGWWRDVEMKLPETVADGVIDEIVNMGGAKVFSRTEIQKVIEEHQFQSSDLVDDKTLVELGKIAGVEYIITGSINDVNFNTTTEERTYKELFTGKKGTEIVTVTRADVELALRMIDVATGEIVLSTRVRGNHILEGGDAAAVISAIKKSCSMALKDIRPEFSERFTIRGYILQTRTSPDRKQRIALVNIGKKDGLRPEQKLIIFTFQEIKDPLTGETILDKVKLPVEAEVTDQIQDDKAWVFLKGDINQIRRVSAGALVERAPIKKPGFLEKLIKSE